MDKKKVKKKLVVGFEMKTTNQGNRSQVDIPEHWNRFFREQIAEKIPNKLSDEILALYTDYEGDYTQPYTYILGYEVSSLGNLPEGLTGRIIPESEYALFTARGIDSLVETWQKIWESPLKRAYKTDFEIYPSDALAQENPNIEVYVSL